MTDATQFPDAAQTNRLLARIRRINPVWIVLLVLVIAIAMMSPPLTEPAGWMNFLRRSAPLIILAAGQVFVIVVGGFDLSVGSLVTFVVLGSSLLIDGDPAKTYWVIALMFAIGAAVGVINGAVVTKLRVPSIIATLGMMLALRGLALSWSGGSPQGYLPENFRAFGRVIIREVPVLGIFPVAVIVLAIVAAILIWLMHGTRYGKLAHAVGDNPRAAELAGVNVTMVRIGAFLVSALSAVIGGILLGGFAGVSTNVGDGLELQAIAAAVIGGAQLLGGRGSVPAAMAGALTLMALFTLLNLLGLPNPMRDVIQGLILIGAVAYTVLQRRKSA
jgi:ribose transport system permease protein